MQPETFDSSVGSLADRIAAVVRGHGERPAILPATGRPITYAELDRRSAAVCDALIARRIGPGARVALMFENPVQAVCALLGVVRSGALAVPLIPSHAPARLREMAADCAPAIVLTTERHLSEGRVVAGDADRVLDVDPLEPAACPRRPAIARETPAVVLYTSGSTGRPKGVVQTHRTLLHTAAVCARTFETTPADRIAWFSSYAVGQGMTAIFGATLLGATLCPFDVRREGLAAMAEWLVERRVSVYISTATLFRSLARSLDGHDRRFDHVRLVRLGGERVTPADVEAHRRLFAPECRFLVSYASTETGPIALHDVARDELFPDGIVPVGPPVEGVTILVRDEQGRDVPPGEAGEIVVRSAWLSPGYWADPARTAEAFSSAPDGCRDYRTGDIGRVRNGRLELLGRKESRVKVRGFRVELEEVGGALEQIEGVVRAVVVAAEHGSGDAALVAYVQPAPGARLAVDQLRAALLARLPDHAVPSAFVLLDTLPLTESGKIDRARLPQVPAERPPLSSAWAAPRTDVERTVAEIWRDVLGVDGLGIHDAFLTIGGDSLKATQVASRLTSAFGCPIRLVDLLDASTIAQTAELVERKRAPQGA